MKGATTVAVDQLPQTQQPSERRFLSYDFQTRTGLLAMASGSWDMGTSLAVFEAIDPRVANVFTLSNGDVPDTAYVRVNGEWRATVLRKPS
jgi:hypothetical protein